jgi:hypothetical protein
MRPGDAPPDLSHPMMRKWFEDLPQGSWLGRNVQHARQVQAWVGGDLEDPGFPATSGWPAAGQSTRLPRYRPPGTSPDERRAA